LKNTKNVELGMKSLEIESVELFVGHFGVAVAEAVFEELAGELGEFEGFLQALSGRHATEDVEVDAVVGAGFEVHKGIIPCKEDPI